MYYRPSSEDDEEYNEHAQPNDDWMGKMVQAWEKASEDVDPSVRRVVFRIGLVLGLGGGTLQSMYWPFFFGLGGVMGSGRQWMPWIHMDDMVGMMCHAMENENVTGAFNGTAPNPVTNYEFTKTMGRVMHRPTLVPVPGFVLRWTLGERSGLLVLGSRVVPHRVLESGYTFKFSRLEEAMRDLLD